MDERHRRAARGLPPHKTEAELEEERREHKEFVAGLVGMALVPSMQQRRKLLYEPTMVGVDDGEK